MFLPAIEHDFCLNPTVTRSLSPFITPNVLASPFFISKSTITAISLIPLFSSVNKGEVCCGQVQEDFFFLLVMNLGHRLFSFRELHTVSPMVQDLGILTFIVLICPFYPVLLKVKCCNCCLCVKPQQFFFMCSFVCCDLICSI